VKVKALVILSICLLGAAAYVGWNRDDNKLPQQTGTGVPEISQAVETAQESTSPESGATSADSDNRVTVAGPSEALVTPEDEPVQQGPETEINIGPLLDPEHDDPNLGQPPSEPVEIGELLDPETYIPPAPANEQEINIGPLLPPPGDDKQFSVDEKPEVLVEIGKPTDAEAEVIE